MLSLSIVESGRIVFLVDTSESPGSGYFRQSLPARATAACKLAANHLGREKFTAGRKESCLSLHQPITIVLHVRSLCRHFIGRQRGCGGNEGEPIGGGMLKLFRGFEGCNAMRIVPHRCN